MLTAMNTGHSGGGGTIHANTAMAVPARLTALGALAGLSADGVRLQASSALDVVIHVERTQRGREVTCVGLIADGGNGLIVRPAVEITRTGALVQGPGWAALVARLGLVEGDAQ